MSPAKSQWLKSLTTLTKTLIYFEWISRSLPNQHIDIAHEKDKMPLLKHFYHEEYSNENRRYKKKLATKYV